MLPKLGLDFGREPRPPVGHRQEDPRDRERRVQPRLHEIDRSEELRQALERVVLGLNRHDRPAGSRECIHRERPERRRAVEEHERVVVERAPERIGQIALAALSGGELDLCRGEAALRHHDVEIRKRCRPYERGQRRAVQQVVRRRPVGLHPEPRGRIRLRVEVDQEHALAGLREARADVDRRRRLADAALLVRDCVDPGGHVGKPREGAARAPPDREAGGGQTPRPPAMRARLQRSAQPGVRVSGLRAATIESATCASQRLRTRVKEVTRSGM